MEARNVQGQTQSTYISPETSSESDDSGIINTLTTINQDLRNNTAAQLETTISHRLIKPTQQREDKSVITFIQKNISDRNTTYRDNDKILLTTLPYKPVYHEEKSKIEKDINLPSRYRPEPPRPKPITFIPKSTCSDNAYEFDNSIFSFIQEHRNIGIIERSFLISRVFCQLSNEYSQLIILEGYGHSLTGADLAYMARNSPLLVADTILDHHIERIPAPALAEIAQKHPRLLGAYIVVKRCFHREDEWPYLLKACHFDKQLAVLIFDNCALGIRYYGMRHAATIACSHKDIADRLCDELMDLLCDNDNSDERYHHEWNDDQMTAWILMLRYEQWAVDCCITMSSIKKQFSKQTVALIQAEILSRHHNSKSKEIDNLITEDTFRFIFRFPTARRVLLRSPPEQFLDILPLFAQFFSKEDQQVLLECCPHLATVMFNFNLCRQDNIAKTVDSYPDSAGQACSIFSQKLSEREKRKLYEEIQNPSVHEIVRTITGNQFRQIHPPYRDTRVWINHFIKNRYKPSSLSHWHIHNLVFYYPCLTSLLLLKSEDPLRKSCINESEIQQGTFTPYIPQPQTCLYLCKSSDVSEKNRVLLAGLHRETLDILIAEHDQFLIRSDFNYPENSLYKHILKPAHKSSAIKALHFGFLNGLNNPEIVNLCLEHQEFAIQLIEQKELLNRLNPILLSIICSRHLLFSNILREKEPQLWKATEKYIDTIQETVTPVKYDSTVYRGESDASILELLINQSLCWLQHIEQPFPYQTPLTCKWSPEHLQETCSHRLEGKHLSYGLSLDFARWQSRHPERHPSLYIQKLDAYSANGGLPSSRQTGSLPDRVNFIGENPAFYTQKWLSLSSSEPLVEGAEDLVPCINRTMLPRIFEYIKEKGVLLISRANHCGIVLIWKTTCSGTAHMKKWKLTRLI